SMIIVAYISIRSTSPCMKCETRVAPGFYCELSNVRLFCGREIIGEERLCSAGGDGAGEAFSERAGGSSGGFGQRARNPAKLSGANSYRTQIPKHRQESAWQ